VRQLQRLHAAPLPEHLWERRRGLSGEGHDPSVPLRHSQRPTLARVPTAGVWELCVEIGLAV
jgi:hypothetical protein